MRKSHTGGLLCTISQSVRDWLQSDVVNRAPLLTRHRVTLSSFPSPDNKTCFYENIVSYQKCFQLCWVEPVLCKVAQSPGEKNKEIATNEKYVYREEAPQQFRLE